MKKLFCLIALAAMLWSCGSQKPTVEKETKVTDSTSISKQTKVRDTVVKIEADTVFKEIPIKEISYEPLPFFSKSGRVSGSIQKVGKDTVRVDCYSAELEKRFKLLDSLIRIERNRKEVKTETITQTETYVPWWVELLAWAGGIALVIMAFFVGRKTILR